MPEYGWHALVVLGALLALLAAVLVVVALRARRWLLLETQADSIHYARTDDGWRLALHRYIPADPRQGELPVILCHGLGANRFNLDFDDRYSLARFLRQRGYDVFVLELRGTGLSGHVSAPGARPDYCFDDHVRKDLPAAIALVCELTGAQRVNWVGHSLGGMVMYAALSGALAEKVHAVITVGAPPTLQGHWGLRLISRLHPLLRIPALTRNAWWLRRIAPFAGWTTLLPGASILANPANMERRVVGQVFYNLVTDVSPGVLKQMAGWALRGKFISAGGDFDYGKGLAKLQNPILFVGGSRDWFCPERALRHGFDTVTSKDKEIVVCGRRTGFSTDYGHGDLIIGNRAPSEIFPLIEKFLWRHRRVLSQGGIRAA